MRFILIALLFAACSKKNDVCWRCEIGSNVNGMTMPDRTVCLPEGEEPDLGEIRDSQGNEYGWYCEKK